MSLMAGSPFAGSDEEHDDKQEHRSQGGGQGQEKVEPESDVLLPEGEGDVVRKVGEAAGHGLDLGILRSYSWGWVDDAIARDQSDRAKQTLVH